VTPRSSEPAGGFLPAWGSPERDRRPNAAQRLPAAHPGREARNRRACLPVTNTRPAFAQAAGRTKWPGLGRVPVTAVAFKLGDMPQTHRTDLIWTADAMIDVDPVFVQNGGSARVFSLILAITQRDPPRRSRCMIGLQVVMAGAPIGAAANGAGDSAARLIPNCGKLPASHARFV
jgi:hypothetical protein